MDSKDNKQKLLEATNSKTGSRWIKKTGGTLSQTLKAETIAHPGNVIQAKPYTNIMSTNMVMSISQD